MQRAVSLHVSDDCQPRAWLLALEHRYADGIEWSAPGRGLEIRGREHVIAHLAREAQAMEYAELTLLRRFEGERQSIDEHAARFVYTGAGLEGAPIRADDLVELKRVRIIDLQSGRVVRETCIETWAVLPRALPKGCDRPHA